MGRIGNGPSLPLAVLLVSVAVYFSAFVAAGCEMKFDKDLYQSMCSRYTTCWPALWSIWALALSFGVLSFVASFILLLTHHRQPSRHHKLTLAILIIIALLWLVVIVLGWLPLNISLAAGTNALPEWDKTGTSYSTSMRSKDPAPSVGMFHYALAWYREGVLANPSAGGRSFPSVRDHGITAMAAVVLCNISFAWSVLALPIMFVHVLRSRKASRPVEYVTKEPQGAGF